MAVASWANLLWTNTADGTAYASSASEVSLLTGLNDQPVFWAGFFEGPSGLGRSFRVKGAGILGTTGTPTYTFQLRLGTTQGASNLGGSSIGVTSAITTGSGVTNKLWFFEATYTVRVMGMGSGNATISGVGWISSPSGFASPFVYPIEITAPDTATWTQTFDAGVTQFINFSVTSSANSASNTLTLKQFTVEMLN